MTSTFTLCALVTDVGSVENPLKSFSVYIKKPFGMAVYLNCVSLNIFIGILFVDTTPASETSIIPHCLSVFKL